MLRCHICREKKAQRVRRKSSLVIWQLVDGDAFICNAALIRMPRKSNKSIWRKKACNEGKLKENTIKNNLFLAACWSGWTTGVLCPSLPVLTPTSLKGKLVYFLTSRTEQWLYETLNFLQENMIWPNLNTKSKHPVYENWSSVLCKTLVLLLKK